MRIFPHKSFRLKEKCVQITTFLTELVAYLTLFFTTSFEEVVKNNWMVKEL